MKVPVAYLLMQFEINLRMILSHFLHLLRNSWQIKKNGFLINRKNLRQYIFKIGENQVSEDLCVKRTFDNTYTFRKYISWRNLLATQSCGTLTEYTSKQVDNYIKVVAINKIYEEQAWRTHYLLREKYNLSLIHKQGK